MSSFIIFNTFLSLLDLSCLNNGMTDTLRDALLQLGARRSSGYQRRVQILLGYCDSVDAIGAGYLGNRYAVAVAKVV